jgi:hypothetical protein
MHLLTTYSPDFIARRYFMTSVLSIVIFGITQNESMRYRFWWMPFISIIAFIAILLNQIDIYKVNQNAKISESVKNLREVAEYLQKERFNIVEASFWNTGVLRAHSNGSINTKHWAPDSSNLTSLIWLTDKSVYREYQNTPTILLTTDNEELNFNETSKSRLLMGEKLIKIGEFNLYKFDRAQLSLIEFPKIGGESREYDFYNWGWLINAKIDYDKGAVITEPSGGLFFGPYVDVEKGIYDFILDYEVSTPNSDIVGEFIISTDNGKNVLHKSVLVSGKNQLVVNGVRFENSPYVQTLGIAYNGNIIEFKKIIIIKE